MATTKPELEVFVRSSVNVDLPIGPGQPVLRISAVRETGIKDPVLSVTPGWGEGAGWREDRSLAVQLPAKLVSRFVEACQIVAREQGA
jgi:hypothetical protein